MAKLKVKMLDRDYDYWSYGKCSTFSVNSLIITLRIVYGGCINDVITAQNLIVKNNHVKFLTTCDKHDSVYLSLSTEVTSRFITCMVSERG